MTDDLLIDDFLTDFNTAVPQCSLIPLGTIVKVSVKVCPGGHRPDGWLSKSTNTGSIYLNTEFTVIEGPYLQHKIHQIIGIKSSKFSTDVEDRWGGMGRSMIRAILESARNIYPYDDREQAKLARKIKSISELNGLQCIVKIGIETSEYGDKNKVISVITPDHQVYADLMHSSSLKI